MIDHYEFGSITIDGTNYNHDVIITSDNVIKWWRKEGHSICEADLKDLPASFDVLVIGNGASGCCEVPDEIIAYAKKKGNVIVQMTGEATETYNRLLSEKKNVVGAFHLTC